ncbi:MAG: hypothetical protein ACLVJ6_10885 [Merdibacter sp.]
MLADVLDTRPQYLFMLPDCHHPGDVVLGETRGGERVGTVDCIEERLIEYANSEPNGHGRRIRGRERVVFAAVAAGIYPNGSCAEMGVRILSAIPQTRFTGRR